MAELGALASGPMPELMSPEPALFASLSSAGHACAMVETVQMGGAWLQSHGLSVAAEKMVPSGVR